MFRPLLRLLALVLSLAVALPASADQASDFTLRDIDGQSWKLSDHKGEVVVLSFWATWCGPCKEEMPHLQRIHAEKADKGVTIISISIDDARTASRVKPYIKSKGFGFTVLLDKDSSVTGVYNPGKQVPFTVVIGKDFEVADAHAGYDPGDEVKLEALIDELLAK